MKYLNDGNNGSEIYGNAEEIAKLASEKANDTLKNVAANDDKNVVGTTPSEVTPVETDSKEKAPSVPVKRTYVATEMQEMFSRGEDYSDSERNSMSESQYRTYRDEAAKYLDTHDTLGGPEVESKSGKALDREAEELARKARFVAEESEEPEYAEYNAKFKRFDDALTNNGLKWKDLSADDRNVLRGEINEAYDYAEKQRGHARVFWDAVQRGVGGVPTMMYQGYQTMFGGEDGMQRVREAQREQELDDIQNPKRSASYSNIKSFGDFVDWASEGVGENVPRAVPGIVGAVAGGAVAGPAGVMVGGSLGGLFLNVGEGAQDQLAEEELNRLYGDGRFQVNRGAATAQGIGYSVAEGALGVVPGFGKMLSSAFGRLGGKAAAQGFIKAATETAEKATLKGFGKALAKNAIEEGVEEVSQSGIIAPVRRLFQTGSALKDGQQFYGKDPVSGMESFLHEELDEFLGGAVVGGLMGGSSSAVESADAKRRLDAHSYVARLGGILDGDPEFAKFDNKSKMLVGRHLHNDGVLETNGLVNEGAKARMRSENSEIDAELRRMAESGTDEEKLQAQAVNAYLNILEGRFALDDFNKVVEEAKANGMYSEAFTDGRTVTKVDKEIGNENGDVAEVYTDEESGVQKWRILDKDGKELGWTTGNRNDRKSPIIDKEHLVLKTEAEADEQARDTDIFNQYRTEKNKAKATAINNIFEKMYGGRGISLELVDRMAPEGAQLRVGKDMNKAGFMPGQMKVVVDIDQVKSVGQLYALLGHERMHADIADYILKAANVAGANGVFTNTKKGKSYQVIGADGVVDINALNAAQDDMLANTVGAEAMTKLNRDEKGKPINDWGKNQGRTGQELLAESASVEDLRMSLIRGERGVFGSVLEKVQRAIGMKMALDMGISAESLTASDVMDEVREITRRGYLGINGERTDMADNTTKVPVNKESVEDSRTDNTEPEASAEASEAPRNIVQPTGKETFGPGHVVRRSDGELFTRTEDGAWEDAAGNTVDDAAALNGGYENVVQGKEAPEATAADTETTVSETETAVTEPESPVETEQKEEPATKVAENAPENNAEKMDYPVGTIVERDDGTRYVRIDGEVEENGVSESAWREVEGAKRKTQQGNVFYSTRGGASKIVENAPKTPVEESEAKPQENVAAEAKNPQEVVSDVSAKATVEGSSAISKETKKEEVQEEPAKRPVQEDEKHETKSTEEEPKKTKPSKSAVNAVKQNRFVRNEEGRAGEYLTSKQYEAIAGMRGEKVADIAGVEIGDYGDKKNVVFVELDDGTMGLFDSEGAEINPEEGRNKTTGTARPIDADDDAWDSATIGARFKSLADIPQVPKSLDFLRSKKKSGSKKYAGLTKDALLSKAVHDRDDDAMSALLSDYSSYFSDLFDKEGLDEKEQETAYRTIVGEISDTFSPKGVNVGRIGQVGKEITADALIQTIAREAVDNILISKKLANEKARAEARKTRRGIFSKKKNTHYLQELRDTIEITDEDRQKAHTTAGQIALAKMAANDADMESRDIARAVILDELVYKRISDPDVASKVFDALMNSWNNERAIWEGFTDKSKGGKDIASPLSAFIGRAASRIERQKARDNVADVSLDQSTSGENDEKGSELGDHLWTDDGVADEVQDIASSLYGDPGINVDQIARGMYDVESSYKKTVDRINRLKEYLSSSNAALIDAYLGYVNDGIARTRALLDELMTAAREDKGNTRYLSDEIKPISEAIGFKKTMRYLAKRIRDYYTMNFSDDEIVKYVAEKIGIPEGFAKARMNNLMNDMRIAFNARDKRFSESQRSYAREELGVDRFVRDGVFYYNVDNIIQAMSDAGYDEMAAVATQTEQHPDESANDIAERIKKMRLQKKSRSKAGRKVIEIIGQDVEFDGRHISEVKKKAFDLFGWLDPRARDITSYRKVVATREADAVNTYLESAGWKPDRIAKAKEAYEKSEEFAKDRAEKREEKAVKQEQVNIAVNRIRELAAQNDGDYSDIFREFPFAYVYDAVARYERGLVEQNKRKLESERKKRVQDAKDEEARQRILAEIEKEKADNPELEEQYTFYELQDMVREFFNGKPENEFASGEIYQTAENMLVDEMSRRDPVLSAIETDYRNKNDIRNKEEKAAKDDEEHRRNIALGNLKTSARNAVMSVREEMLRSANEERNALRDKYKNENRVREAEKKKADEIKRVSAIETVKKIREEVEKSREKDVLGEKTGAPKLSKYGYKHAVQKQIDKIVAAVDGIKGAKTDAAIDEAIKGALQKGLSEETMREHAVALRKVYDEYVERKEAFDLVEAEEAKAKESATDEGARLHSDAVVTFSVNHGYDNENVTAGGGSVKAILSRAFWKASGNGRMSREGIILTPIEINGRKVKNFGNIYSDDRSSPTRIKSLSEAFGVEGSAGRNRRRVRDVQQGGGAERDRELAFEEYADGLADAARQARRDDLAKIETGDAEHDQMVRDGIRFKTDGTAFPDGYTLDDFGRKILSPNDMRAISGIAASLDAHRLGLDYQKIVKKDKTLVEEAEFLMKDGKKMYDIVERAMAGKPMGDREIVAMTFTVANLKAHMMLERDVSTHVAPEFISDVDMYGEALLNKIAEALRIAGNRAGASLRSLQLAMSVMGTYDSKAYMLNKLKSRMAKEGVEGEPNPKLVEKIEEMAKMLEAEHEKVVAAEKVIEQKTQEAAEADAKAEVKYEAELAKKLADAKAAADKRAKDEYERGAKESGKPFTRSPETYKALGLKTEGFDFDGAAASLARKFGVRMAGNPKIVLDEEARAAFDEFYAGAGNDINVTRNAIHELFKGQLDAAFDVYADELASRIAKAKAKSGLNSGRKATVDDEIDAKRKDRKAKAAKRAKAEDLKAISDYNEYLAKLANAHADNALRAIDAKASRSDRREALGEALRAFYKMMILEKPDVDFEKVVGNIIAEGQRIIRSEITKDTDPEYAASIEENAKAFGREDAINAVRGTDGYRVQTRQSALSDRETLIKAKALASKGRYIEAADLLGFKYMDDAAIVDALIAQAVKDMNRLGGVLASQFGGKQDEDVMRKFNELRKIVRDLKSSELTKDEKIAKYIDLAPEIKRYHRQRSLSEELQIRIDKLTRRLEENDFERKPKQTKPMLDGERAKCAALQVEYRRLQLKCKNAQEQWDLRKTSGMMKLFKGASSVLLDMKGVVGSLDLSSCLRQGGQLSWAHPALFYKNLKKTLKALASDEAYKRMMREIYEMPTFKYMEKAGVFFADYGDMAMNGNEEEVIMLRHYRQITRFKLAKMGIDCTERAFVAFLNFMRADVFNALVKSAAFDNLDAVTDTQWRAIGRFINIGSQRGDVEGNGAVEKAIRAAIPAANYVMWSPRNMLSRLQFLKESVLLPLSFVNYKGRALYESYGDATLRKVFAKELLRYLGGVTTMIAFSRLMAELFRGDDEPPTEVIMDPRSSDFMKVKIGNTRLDFLSGLQQILVFSSRALSKKKTNLRGQTHEIYNTYDLIGRFLRSKMAPGTGMMYDLLVSKETFDRQDISWNLRDLLTDDKEKIGGLRYIAGSTMVPLTLRDLKEQIVNTGLAETVFTFPLTMLGAGVQAFDPYTYKQMKEDFRYFKRAYSEITDPQERKDFIERHQMLNRAGSIEAQIKTINRIEKDIKRIEKDGGKPGDWMLDNLEREKKRAINLMAGFKNPFDTGE